LIPSRIRNKNVASYFTKLPILQNLDIYEHYYRIHRSKSKYFSVRRSCRLFF